MSTIVEIDETDSKILKILIEDARTSLKEIAKRCDISSVSVLNRIKRLKKLGVIRGSALFAALNTFGLYIAATIGMETDADVGDIAKYFEEHTYLIELSTCIGEYDLCALVYAENIVSLNDKIETVRRRFGIRKVIVNVWSGLPILNYENLDLNPTKKW